jgi:isocitrate/isopropylmalate dehydrogenase
MVAALDENYVPSHLMAEAAHGTAPSLAGKNVANPLAMILAGAALLAHGDEEMRRVGNVIRSACFDAIRGGVCTSDLGGASGTAEFTDEVIARVRGLLSL